MNGRYDNSAYSSFPGVGQGMLHSIFCTCCATFRYRNFPLFFPYGENLGSDTVVRINTENIDFAWKTERIEHKSE